MTEELQLAVESGSITPKAAEIIALLTPGAFCLHKSWGFGRVAEWSLPTGLILIDFDSRKRHPMQAPYAAETLSPIPNEHILARSASDAAAVKTAATKDPVGLVRDILRDHGGRATPTQISAVLTPIVFTLPAYKKWWEATKKKLKGDGHFQLPVKKTDPIVLLDVAVAPGSGLIERFRGARHLKDQVAALDQVTKALGDFVDEVEELRSLAAQIEEAAHKGRKLQPAQALELLLARDEILARHDALQPGENAPAVADILTGEQSRLPELFAALPASKQRRAVEQFPVAFGEDWMKILFRLAQQAPARLVVDITRVAKKEGREAEFAAALARWISERSASSEILIWLCKERGADFPNLFGPDLLSAVFSALELDQLNEKRGTRLQDLLFDDRELISDFIKDAKPDEVRDLTRRLIMSPVFEEMIKRSLLGRIIKLHPEMQSLVSGESTSQTETLTVSWASLEKRKEEFEDLINRQIPENLRDITIAKEEGDLRENFGFKAAKEQQRVLQRRRAEGERDLELSRGTNFENADTSQVSIGTSVSVRLSDGKEETFNILGAWDSAPDLSIVSYKAAIGQALMGHKPGDEVELPSEGGTYTVAIQSISAFTAIDVLREKVHALRPSKNVEA
jgi:transcription elongation GreA/GreB family factor